MYGLDLDSDGALPGLAASGAAAVAGCWAVQLGETPLTPPSGEPIYRSDPAEGDAVEVFRPRIGVLHLAFADGAAALVDAAARTVQVAWPPGQTLDDALVYLVGPVLGVALRLLGREVLHASCVDVDGRAVAVLGPAGAGKSTLTAALIDAGQPLVTEDVCVLWFGEDDASPPAVFRGGTRVKLWEDSVAALRGVADALPRLVPSSKDWDKRFLDAAAATAARDLTPLGAVFVLDRRADVVTPVVEEMAGPARLLTLIANSYAASVLDAAGRARQLERLGALAAAVPVRRLSFPDRFDALPPTVDALLADVRGGKVAR